MKGWHNESARHSLAARGISTKARALIKPWGVPNPLKVEHITRMDRSIKDLGRILRAGQLNYTDNNIYGGLTTAWPIDEGSNISGLGWVIMSLDPEVMFEYNDIVKIEYTPEFFRDYEDIGQRVRGNITDATWKPEDLIDFRDEKELVSYNPIMIPPEAVIDIEIHYGDDVPDPITGNEETETPWEPGSDEHLEVIIKTVKYHIPEIYWDRIRIMEYDKQHVIR